MCLFNGKRIPQNSDNSIQPVRKNFLQERLSVEGQLPACQQISAKKTFEQIRGIIFVEKYMKMKKNWTYRGRVPYVPYIQRMNLTKKESIHSKYLAKFQAT